MSKALEQTSVDAADRSVAEETHMFACTLQGLKEADRGEGVTVEEAIVEIRRRLPGLPPTE